jgi:TPR repeat protein
MLAFASFAAPSLAGAGKLEEAYELRMACETGERNACYMLGHAYETREDLWGEPVRGELVKRDDGAALRYFRKACEMGDGKGCRRLGRMYEFGKGAAKNNIEALRYYLLACDQREKQLCKDLSEMLER